MIKNQIGQHRRAKLVLLLLLLGLMGLFCVSCGKATEQTAASAAGGSEANVTAEGTAASAATAGPAVTTAPADPTQATDAAAGNTKTQAAQEADRIMAGMTLEEKVAQMFWVRCPAETTDAAAVQKQYQFGGYILFGSDFENSSKAEVTQTVADYQAVSRIPMLIGTDEEGGTVTRVSHYPQYRKVPFWSPRALYAEGGFDLVESNELEKATLLNSLGINVNLAPVCDIATDPDDFMYDRSFGGTPQMTGEFVQRIVQVSQDNGVGTVLKHFPGYGNNADTHTGIAIDERPYETFVSEDFVPFESGIAAGCGCVLVSHNIVKCIDSAYPASLSAGVHTVLRDVLHFDGVVMTDDLSMDAITDYTDGQDAAVQAVLAGNDLLCVKEYESKYNALMTAVQEGKIQESRIEESVRRILEWKIRLGIIRE